MPVSTSSDAAAAVSIRLLNDVRLDGESTSLARGTELRVSATTAAALVLSGAAIQVPPPLTP